MKALSITMVLTVSFLLLLVGSYAGQKASALQNPAIARFIAVDIESKKSSDIGETSVFAQRILDPSGNIIGNSFSSCILIAKEEIFAGGRNLCDGVYNLPKGKITFKGSRKNRERYTFVVTGGTGFYSGVGGRLNGFVIGSDPFREKLIFHIQ